MFCHFQDVEGRGSHLREFLLSLPLDDFATLLTDLKPTYSPFVFGGTHGWNRFWNHPLILKMGVQVDSGQEGCLGWMDQMDGSEKTNEARNSQ